MQTINTALLSFGMSGWVFHAPFLSVHNGFTFAGVWERTKNLAQERYPGVRTFRTLDELLADPSIELVVVNTPNYTHFDYTRRALLAGKNVVVEKPFTVTVAEGEELLALSQQKGLLLSVYHNRRFDSDYKVVRRVVTEGMLGSIVEAEFHFDRYKEDLSPKVHKESPGPGTGALYDLGSHLVDQALQLFGMPDAVFADIRIVRQVSQVDDYFELLLYYPDKRVRLRSSYLVREALPAYILHGTKGSFIKSKSDVQETALQANQSPADPSWGPEPESERGLLHTERNGTIIREFLPSEHGHYGAYYEGIYQALRHEGPNPVPAADGLNVIRVITAAFESNETKQVISM
ncbi:MAG: oxidoreductase [Flaviaesturariibacter sp.]|nr:oxidoreductase [Flaviaesturariibacter sp.]